MPSLAPDNSEGSHPDGMMDDTPKPLIEHIRDLKRAILISMGALLLCSLLAFFFAEPLYQFLLQPLARAQGAGGRMIYTGLTEAFFTYLKLAFYTGFMAAFPVIAWQLYRFLAPGLYRQEKKVFLPFLIAAPLLFLLGACVAYFGIFPMAWQFFLGFEHQGAGMAIELEARVSEYLSLVLGLLLAFGLAFQLPIFLMLLAKAGFVSAASLRKKRKYAILGLFLLAAIITPPDIISQIGLALPLLLLYELTILAVARMGSLAE